MSISASRRSSEVSSLSSLLQDCNFDDDENPSNPVPTKASDFVTPALNGRARRFSLCELDPNTSLPRSSRPREEFPPIYCASAAAPSDDFLDTPQVGAPLSLSDLEFSPPRSTPSDRPLRLDDLESSPVSAPSQELLTPARTTIRDGFASTMASPSSLSRIDSGQSFYQSRLRARGSHAPSQLQLNREREKQLVAQLDAARRARGACESFLTKGKPAPKIAPWDRFVRPLSSYSAYEEKRSQMYHPNPSKEDRALMEHILGGPAGDRVVATHIPPEPKAPPPPRLYRDRVPVPKKFLTTSPDRILDLPTTCKDWYSSPIAYGKESRMLASGMSEELYILHSKTNKLDQLQTPNLNFTATSWMGKKLIGAGTSNAAEPSAQISLYQVTSAGIRECATYNAQSKVPLVTRPLGDAFSTDCFAMGFYSGHFELFDSRKGASTLRFQPHDHILCGLEVSPNGTLFATGGGDEEAMIWDARMFSPASDPISRVSTNSDVKAISWHPTDRSLIAIGTGSEDKRVLLYNTHTNAIVSTFDTKARVSGLEWLTSDTFAIGHGRGQNENLLSLCKFDAKDSSITTKFSAQMFDPAHSVLSMIRGFEDEQHLNMMLYCNDEALRFFNVATAIDRPQVVKEAPRASRLDSIAGLSLR